MCLALAVAGCKKNEKTAAAAPARNPVISETPFQKIFMERGQYENKTVVVTGKVFREENTAPDTLILLQYLAFHPQEGSDRELRLKAAFKGAADLPFNSWVRVQGVIRGNAQGLVLEAESLSVIPRPERWVKQDLTHQH
jgi:uncharacterized membrane protein YcgQ (UPF0703/DUF1980 family)